jgi:effector-binding domain-containing protein
MDSNTVYTKTVPDILVAGIRFHGKVDSIGDAFCRLWPAAKGHISGPAICLYHSGSLDAGFDLEVCCPISAPVSAGEVKSRVLEGGDMLCTVHNGPYGPPEAEVSLSKTWNAFWRHIGSSHIGIDEGPEREVYLEDWNVHGDHPERFVTELQIPLLFPRWMRCFEEGLDRQAGEVVRRRVMEGSAGLSPIGDVRDRYVWTRRAMERLDAAVPDEDTRREIMCGCAHVYPREQREWLKGHYRRLGSVDALIAFLRADPGYEGAPYYRDPSRAGNVIFIDKKPQQRKLHDEATDPVAKRAAACHCPTIKAAILAGEEVPFTFCGCGTGWFKPVWEEIVGTPVRVVCEESVLRGDDRCRFAIYLPDGA